MLIEMTYFYPFFHANRHDLFLLLIIFFILIQINFFIYYFYADKMTDR